jgi:hypothetical protein
MFFGVIGSYHLPININLPAFLPFMVVDPLLPRGVGGIGFPVPAVLAVGGGAKVLNPVVCPVAIDVIDFFGQRSMVHEPNEPVSANVLASDTHNPVSVFVKAIVCKSMRLRIKNPAILVLKMQ